MVTWQDAEDTMTAAVEYLFAMPDRERGLLAGGRGERMTNWPQVVRSVREGDYGDGQGFGGEASASPQLTRRCVDLVERMAGRQELEYDTVVDEGLVVSRHADAGAHHPLFRAVADACAVAYLCGT